VLIGLVLDGKIRPTRPTLSFQIFCFFITMPRRGTKKKKEPMEWEIAKALLIVDINEGELTDDMDDTVIHRMKTEYRAIQEDRFKENLKNLSKKLWRDHTRAMRDQASLVHDNLVLRNRQNNAPNLAANGNTNAPREPKWDGSRAQQRLKELVQRKEHVGKQPKELYGSNSPICDFALKIVRGHLHQELASQRQSNYWAAKRSRQNRNGPPMRKNTLVCITGVNE
jgi:hypothetical protein